MTDREKMIELIQKAKYICANDYSDHSEDEYIADILLDNGVIVPPCKVGDTVYYVCLGKIYSLEITKFDITEHGMYAYSSSAMSLNFENFGERIFLTKEEAEKALAERSKR